MPIVKDFLRDWDTWNKYQRIEFFFKVTVVFIIVSMAISMDNEINLKNSIKFGTALIVGAYIWIRTGIWSERKTNPKAFKERWINKIYNFKRGKSPEEIMKQFEK